METITDQVLEVTVLKTCIQGGKNRHYTEVVTIQ